jgi:hypothetical protein
MPDEEAIPMELLARILVLLISLLIIAIIWLAGVLRERLGWSSNIGNVVWWVLGYPVFLGLVLCQILLFRRVSGANPFHDVMASGCLIGQGVIGLGLVFYFAFKHPEGRGGRNTP